MTLGVAENFQAFCSNLSIPKDTRTSISTRYKYINQVLNKNQY